MHNSKETKIIIQDNGIILFTGYSYANIAMSDIPDTCGLTKPSVYCHFKDKKGLFLALTRRILEWIKSIFITIPPLREALILIGKAPNESFENQTDLVRVCLSFLLVPDNQLLIRTLKVR